MSPLSSPAASAKRPIAKPAASPRSQRRGARLLATQWGCLVLAASESRRHAFLRAAEQGGWSPMGCGGVAEAREMLRRWRTQLAAIDFAGATVAEWEEYRAFAQEVVAPERLLVISDQTPSAELELWARQTGAWIYLPAAQPADGLEELFAEAKSAAEKALGVNGSPVAGA